MKDIFENIEKLDEMVEQAVTDAKKTIEARMKKAKKGTELRLKKMSDKKYEIENAIAQDKMKADVGQDND
jgi:hypothetical protein